MKKILLVVALSAVMVLLGGFQARYADIGQWMYEKGTRFEASAAGMIKDTAQLTELPMTYHLRSQPNKPTLVMLHGFSADKTVWTRFAKHFASDYQILVPDLAGHGETPFNADWDYSMPAQAKRVIELMDKLDIQQAHFIGNSMGGFLTATLAIHYPERTLSAVMVDPAGVMSPELSDLFTMLLEGKNPFLVNNRQEFDEFFAMTMHQPPFMPDMVLEAVSQEYIRRQAQLEKIFRDFSESDYLEDKLSKLTAPAMLWWGDKDRLLDVSAVPVWQAGVPHLQVKIFENIGHMPMVEIPKESAQVYSQFLQSLAQ